MRHSLVVFLLLTLTACSLLDPLPTGKPGDTGSQLSAKALYRQAKTELDDESYSTAIKLYETLQSHYPYGRYAQQSMLEMAYAYYRTSEPDPAIATADRFIKQFPNNAHVDYAYYVKGLATFNGKISVLSSISGQNTFERDPQSIRDSYDAFKELITRFPNSIYTADSRVRMQYLINELAKGELQVASYYLRRDAYISAVNRAQHIIIEYPHSPSTRGALKIMIKAYDAMGLTKLRDDTRSVLASNSSANEGTKIESSDATWWQFWK
ncbi:MAG: outer membrane protein assembly factor BamD [Gallionella sp.]